MSRVFKSRVFNAACVQVNASDDMNGNIATIVGMATEARQQGADMVFLPENAVLMTWGRANILANAFPEDEHPGLIALKALARDTGLWVHGGTLHVRIGERAANRTLVISPDGMIVGRYDKIHMFDVSLANGETYRESATFEAGSALSTVALPWGVLGLSVCYDIRFPQLYRALAHAGADIITIPAAFTRTTGEAHWHVLQRARAMENACWVISPAQTGTHANNRQTFGHAVIVDPWGTVVADAGTEPGLIMAEIDMSQVAEVRAMIPSLGHDRPFSLPAQAD